MSQARLLVRIKYLILIGALLTLAIGPSDTGTTIFLPFVANTTKIYWGAMIAPAIYGQTVTPPYSMDAVNSFEANSGKSVSILHWEQRWQSAGHNNRFDVHEMNTVRQHGALSLLDWLSEDDSQPNPDSNRPQYALIHIIKGNFDAYIRQWAKDAKAWGHPFFLRFDYEMNGDWVAWSEIANGNKAGQYVQAWRHVHDIFTQVGASNVTWVWCPNILVPPQYTVPMKELYPGDQYVDWTCLDGYNWGTNPVRQAHWQSFQELFTDSYNQVLSIAPDKPMMIGEFASSEFGGSKSAWITDAVADQIPTNFPEIKAINWFNVNPGGADWAIETSAQSQAAFAAAIRSPYYASNQYGDLDTSPIPPP